MAVHGGPGAEDAGEGGDAEGGVGVGVAGGPGVEALSRRLIGDRLLGVSRHGVVLGVGAQNGAAGAVGGDEGGGHFAGPALHLEAVGLQQVAEGLGGAVFPPGGFGVVPDLAVEVGEGLSVLVNPLEGVLFFGVGSPDVTILGIGITILYMGFFWFILNSTLFQSSRHWNWTRILLGLLLLAIGLAVSQFIARPLTESEDIQAFNSGVYALATLIYIAISVVAGAMVVSGMPSRMSEGKDSRELHNALRMMLPILIVILGVFITLSAISFTTTVARLDARNTLADAPHARIQFNSSSPEAMPWRGSDECLPGYESCGF